jgi:hypothetical protein
MKLTDHPPKVIDEVMTEVRAIKRGIAERHGNNIDRLLDALIAQERSAGIGKAEQEAGTGQPTTRPVSESEGSDKPQSEAEGRSR